VRRKKPGRFGRHDRRGEDKTKQNKTAEPATVGGRYIVKINGKSGLDMGSRFLRQDGES
jgi:hypothetical protein